MPASLKHLSDPKQLSENSVGLLAKWTDGLYYKGKVVECEQAARRCLVEFEDATKEWVSASDLHLQLVLDNIPDDQIVCCVCDDGKSKAPNELIICDYCQQGYHIDCHQPTIDREAARLDDEDSEWLCFTCKQIAGGVAPAVPPPRTPNAKAVKKAKPSATKKTPRSTKIKLGKTTSSPKEQQPLDKDEQTVSPVAKIEKMNDSPVISMAKALSQRADNIGTEDFIGMVANREDNKDKTDSTVNPTGRQPRKAAKAAAAY